MPENTTRHSSETLGEQVSRLTRKPPWALSLGEGQELTDLLVALYEQLEAAQTENAWFRQLLKVAPGPFMIPSAASQEAIDLGRELMRYYGRGVSNPATTLGNGDLVKPSKADSDVCHNASNPAKRAEA